MSQEGQWRESGPPRPAPKERTFAEVFPWRNLRRAFMLVVLIVGILIIKRSMARLLGTANQMWGAPATTTETGRDFGVHLSPTLRGPPVEPKAAPSIP
jgi:hypothetical protein